MIVNNNLYICNMEIYKDIKGFEGRYQVSNLGNVKSLGRIVKHSYGGDKLINEKILKPRINKYGYLMCVLSKDADKKYVNTHRLVAEAFIPNPDNKEQVNHINGVKHDNRLENLEWNTKTENIQHAFNIGLKLKGEKHHNSKLTEEQVLEIRSSNLSLRVLAKRYQVSHILISNVKNRKTYK